jgi:mono/diheme cytochrome c family protein
MKVVKRISIIVLIISGLAISGLALAACGSNDLAEDLTPIPTLAPGQTPTLIAALSGEASTEEANQEASAESTEEAAAASGTQEASDAAGGDPAAGEEIFASTCGGCHTENGDQPAPPRVGMGERAATRVEGMDAAEYLHQSIVDPHAFLVEDYGPIMPDTYDEDFSDEEINDMVAYLLTQ